MAGKRQPDPIPAGTARTLGAAQPAPPTRASEANASNVGLLGRFAGRSQTIWFWAGLLGVITLALGMQAWLYLSQVYWVSPDESGRIEQAWAWTSFSLPHDWLKGLMGIWPPLPKVLTGLALRYVNADLFLTPRALTALFGLLAYGGFLLLAHELFESRPVTLAAGLLAALYSHRVVLSVVPLVEIQYIAWLLWGQYFALLGIKRGRPWCHLAAAACFSLAMMVRYEAWFFGGIYYLLLLGQVFTGRRRVPRWVAGACAALLAAFPIFWVTLYTVYTGKPLGFFQNTVDMYMGTMGNSLQKNFSNSVFYQFFRENLKQLNLLGLIGVLIWVRRAGMPRRWLWIPLGSYLIIGAMGVMGKALPTHNFWRISSIWGITLIPFTAAVCVRGIPARLSLGRRLGLGRAGVALALLAALAGLFLRDTNARRELHRAAPDVVHTGNFIRAIMTTAKRNGEKPFRVMIERNPDWDFIQIEMMARNFSRCVLNNNFDPRNLCPPIQDPQRARYLAKLKADSFRLLVFRGAAFKKNIMTYPGIRPLRRFGSYMVFELASPSK